MAMDKKCCLVTFQYGVDLMWQLLHNFLLFQILCLQIGGSWPRSPTRVQGFVSNGDMFSRCTYCLNCYSTSHNMSLVVIHFSSMFIACAFLKCSITLLVLKRMDKYPCVGIWKYNVYYSGSGVKMTCCSSHVIVDNNTLLA
jgi:hypothetical protein